jgi:TolA-binding protein
LPQGWLKKTVLLMGLCVGMLYADGLEGEYLLTQRWRAITARYSPLTNPALLTEANYDEVHAALSNTMSEFSMLEFGTTIPVGLYQSFGASWFFQGTEPFPKTTAGFQTSSESISDVHNAFLLSYAINPWKRLSIGLNAMVAYRNMYNESQNIGFSFDAGLSYRLARHPVLGDHVLGAAMQNVLPMSFASAFGPAEQYPTLLRFSLLSNFLERRVQAAADFSLKDIFANNALFQNGIKSSEWELDANVSYWFLRLFKVYALMGLDQDGLEYWGVAPALNMPSGFGGRELEVAYQFTAVNDGAALGAQSAYTNSFYLHMELGKHREERYARKMARMASIEPNQLYNRALTLYSQGNYWDAYYVFGRIEVEYPEFFKRDWVSYYMASCQEKLDMRKNAFERFERVRSTYSKSNVAPHAILGMMRLQYRSGKEGTLAELFQSVNQSDVPDSIKAHGRYLMGQSELRKNNFKAATNHLLMVPDNHPDFLFAQYSLAVLRVEADSTTAALAHLQTIVQTPPSSKAQEEIVNRTLVMVGYFYYEQREVVDGALSQAVAALRKVDAASSYYEDALLGLSWIALKAQQWQDCIASGKELENRSTNPYLKAEAALLHGLALMKQNEYGRSIPILEKALSYIDGPTLLATDSLERRRKDYQDVRLEYQTLAESAEQLAANRQTAMVVNQIDSLHAKQRSLLQSLQTELDFFDDYKRQSFFSRSQERVKDDINYALAQSQRMNSSEDVIREQQKLQGKQKNIDQEIEELEKQIQQMDSGGQQEQNSE